MTTDLDDRLAALDPCANAPVTDVSADTLLAAVIATPLEPSRGHRPRLVAAAVAAAVAVGVTGAVLVVAPSDSPTGPGTTASPSAPATPDLSLVSVTKKNGEYVISIKDTKAEAAAVTAALKAHGLNVTVHYADPPSGQAGAFTVDQGKIQRGAHVTLSREFCDDDPAKTCGFGFTVDDGFAGHGDIWLGAR